jgi:hypothetical protein
VVVAAVEMVLVVVRLDFESSSLARRFLLVLMMLLLLLRDEDGVVATAVAIIRGIDKDGSSLRLLLLLRWRLIRPGGGDEALLWLLLPLGTDGAR